MTRKTTTLQENTGRLQLYISTEFVDELGLESGDLLELKVDDFDGDVVVVLDPVKPKEKPNTRTLTVSGGERRIPLLNFPPVLADALGWRGVELRLSTDMDVRGVVVKPLTYSSGEKVLVSGVGVEELDGSVAEVVDDLGNDVYQVRVLVDGENELHNVEDGNFEPRV